MIDTSKLKYYKTLCEKGVLDAQQNDLDDIINILEEKQFEYLKRLETTKDEGRKDEINELLNIIDLQLKEIGSLKAAISSGIIIESKDETASVTKDEKKQIEEEVAEKGTKEGKKGKTWLILAVVAIVAVVAIAAVFMLNGKKADQSTAANDDTAVAEENTSNDEDATKVGIGYFSGDEINELLKENGDDDIYLLEGLYVVDINNQSLLDGGMQLGDRIITVNGENATNSTELRAIYTKYKPGDPLEIVVSRGFEQVTINGSFIKESERLPDRTSGEEIIEIDGRPWRVAYTEDGYNINAWRFGDE